MDRILPFSISPALELCVQKAKNSFSKKKKNSVIFLNSTKPGFSGKNMFKLMNLKIVICLTKYLSQSSRCCFFYNIKTFQTV